VTDYHQGEYMLLKIVGGIIDFKFFIGSSAKEVIAKYHRYLNGWAIHPFWSSGYHQSNWGKY
jgi:alpha-glucosidase